jgi:hypothetical protein
MKQKQLKFDKNLEKRIVGYYRMKLKRPEIDFANIHEFDLIPNIILFEMLRRCRE